MDLINRQDAIDRINKQREHLRPDVFPQDAIGDAAYKVCAEFIERLQPAERWIPVSEKYPKPEEEYKSFLTVDDEGEITIEKFLLSLDEEPQPYFTGMRQIIAWMPLPEPYKESEE